MEYSKTGLWIALILSVLGIGTATAMAQFNGCRSGICPGGIGGPGAGINQPPGAGVPVANGKLMMVDGSSFVLQADAASKICLAGGC